MLAGSGLCGFTQQEIQPIPDPGMERNLFPVDVGWVFRIQQIMKQSTCVG